MKKVKNDVEEVEVDPVVPHTVEHFDRDPNDPRNRPETKALPSLDD